jgi:hypothetical protein
MRLNANQAIAAGGNGIAVAAVYIGKRILKVKKS